MLVALCKIPAEWDCRLWVWGLLKSFEPKLRDQSGELEVALKGRARILWEEEEAMEGSIRNLRLVRQTPAALNLLLHKARSIRSSYGFDDAQGFPICAHSRSPTAWLRPMRSSWRGPPHTWEHQKQPQKNSWLASFNRWKKDASFGKVPWHCFPVVQRITPVR